MINRFDCVCVGATTIDIIALIPGAPKEDEKIPAEKIIIDGGGPAGTCACVLGRHGLKTGLFSFIGLDHWTEFVLENLKLHNVSTRFLTTVPGLNNPVSLILVNKRNASRTITWNSQGTSGQKSGCRTLSGAGFWTRQACILTAT